MIEKSKNADGAGKGDKPRNCFSQKYRNNFDSINWNKKNEKNKTNIDIAPPPKRRLSTFR